MVGISVNSLWETSTSSASIGKVSIFCILLKYALTILSVSGSFGKNSKSQLDASNCNNPFGRSVISSILLYEQFRFTRSGGKLLKIISLLLLQSNIISSCGKVSITSILLSEQSNFLKLFGNSGSTCILFPEIFKTINFSGNFVPSILIMVFFDKSKTFKFGGRFSTSLIKLSDKFNDITHSNSAKLSGIRFILILSKSRRSFLFILFCANINAIGS